MKPGVYPLLQNLHLLSELGRQRCFELGNSFYFERMDKKDLDVIAANKPLISEKVEHRHIPKMRLRA